MRAQVKPMNMTAAWADELGQLQAELAPIREKLKRETKLKELLAGQADADGVNPSVGTLYQGEHYTAAVSERDERRAIVSLYEAYRASKLKIAEFLRHCSLTLKEFDAIVPLQARPGLIAADHAGPRHVKTYARVK